MDTVREPEFPLSETLAEVLQQGAKQTLELRDKQHKHNTLQAALLDLDQSCECVSSDIKLKEKQLNVVHCDIEQIQSNIISLDSHTQTILLENIHLRNSIQDEMENSRSALAGYDSYRTIMKNYRTSVSLVESQADVYKELLEKEQKVSELRNSLEELKVDLQNPVGNTVRQAQKEINILKANIHQCRQTVRERRALLQMEQETQSQLKKEIKIQHRRCEAIIKRLHCQLNKAQSNHRQICSDISHMEKEVQDLKSQLEDAAQPEHHLTSSPV
ncbi:coiled-coil domain-containing protein 122 [Myxocyprinus asiaticus]|uniref:coiled-coil domain-containing protein 122 n=1 Tax=Myxocyprinus asiaticus TaxID=70543 RepID=UPI002222587B|nr:coiled-coil domain-containing protein 122 [Myxocyprinus asiaticus]